MASGDTLLQFTPLHNEPPISTGVFATLDSRNDHPVLDFDDTTNEQVNFSAILPRNYGGGGLTVYLHYAMTSAVAGDIDWGVAFERIGDGQQDIDSNGWAATKTVVNTTVPGTCGHVDIVSIDFSDGAEIDSIAVGEGFRLGVYRVAVDDTAVGDAELLFVEIKET